MGNDYITPFVVSWTNIALSIQLSTYTGSEK